MEVCTTAKQEIKTQVYRTQKLSIVFESTFCFLAPSSENFYTLNPRQFYAKPQKRYLYIGNDLFSCFSNLEFQKKVF